MALMHFPSVRSELLMFPASFSLSPVFWVREQRSDPARSHRASLAIQKNGADCKFVLVWGKTCDQMNPLANAKDSGNTDVLHSDDADGKDAVAEESNIQISYKVTNKHKRAVTVNGYVVFFQWKKLDSVQKDTLLLTSCWTAGLVWWQRNSGSFFQSSSLCRPPQYCSLGPIAGLKIKHTNESMFTVKLSLQQALLLSFHPSPLLRVHPAIKRIPRFLVRRFW